MKQYFSRRIKTLFIFLTVVFIAISMIVWQKYPFGVKHYKTISLGMAAAEKAGDNTGWAPPYNQVPEESDFFVYSGLRHGRIFCGVPRRLDLRISHSR